MVDIKLDVYNAQCFNLAESMYLKFDLHALAVETWYCGTTMTVSEDKTTWLQYMNLAGQYHTSNESMTIKSLDTFEDISFDRDTLELHPTTLSLYKEFGARYDTLVSAYPDNKVLIKGILYGKDIDDIIAMEDFHIVGWNETLVDTQEYNLIDILNVHMSITGTSAGCPDYSNTGILYATLILGYVTSNLPVLIKRIRFNNSKSYNANTFYIWSNINSVINLEEYKSVLTYDDVMYLFKNIIRLKSGSCSKAIFTEILSTIISPKMIDAYYLESNAKISTMDMETTSVEAEWQLKDILSDDTKAMTLTELAVIHSDRSEYLLSDTSGEITDSLYQDYNTNVYPELTLYDNRETEGDIRELLVNVDYSILYAATGLLTQYYELTMPDTGELITLQHGDWLTIYKRVLQIRFDGLTETIPYHTTTQIYRYTSITNAELVAGGLTTEDAASILSIMGIYPVLKNDTTLTQAYTENFVNTKSTIVAILTQAVTKENCLYIDELYGVIFPSYHLSLFEDGVNFEDWIEDTGVLINDMSGDTLLQLEALILNTVVQIDSDSANTLVRSMSGLLSKFVSYKTNISRKMSDTVTLTLGGRQGWIEGGTEDTDLGDLINLKPIPINVEFSDIDHLVYKESAPVEVELDSTIESPLIELESKDLIGTIDTIEGFVNIRPKEITVEITEYNQ